MDDRRDREVRPEEAVFAPRSVRPARPPRRLAALLALVIGGLVVVGLVDRVLPESEIAVDPLPSAPLSAVEPRPTRTPRPAPQSAAPRTFEVIEVELRPAGSHLFVHGDVFSIAVVRVAVSLEDATGRRISSRSVDVPGGSTAFRIGAVERFDVRFTMPDELMGEGVWVSTTAFNDDGRELASFRQGVPRLQQAPS